MRLYYYTAKQWGMKSIWEKRLKIAQYEHLNDPFELQPFTQNKEKQREIAQHIKKVLSEKHGILCFSTSWQSTLMWAHYGDKHRGVCLGFDVEEGDNLMKIKYLERRIAQEIHPDLPHDKLALCLNSKHIGWQYENEYRLRVPLNVKRDGIFYYPFNKEMELREVIIGARSTLSTEDVADALGNLPNADVTIWHADESFEGFNMCENREIPRKTIKKDK